MTAWWGEYVSVANKSITLDKAIYKFARGVGIAQWEKHPLPTNMAPGLIPRQGVICWLHEFVVGSRPRSKDFCSGSLVFLSPQKPALFNSNSIGNSRATGLSVARLSRVPLLNVELFI